MFRMINRDGGVHRLLWTTLPSGMFRAWLQDQPEVAVEGSVWNQVRDALYERIDNEVHAGEWAPDWDPPEPAPVGAVWKTDPDFVQLFSSEARYCLLNRLEEVIAGPICVKCGRHDHIRTDVPLTAWMEIFGGIMSCRNAFAAMPCLLRTTTAEAIGPHRLGVEVRPVTRAGRGRLQALEPVPTRVIRPVAIRGVELFSSRCSTCRGHTPFHRIGQAEYLTAYDATQIPRNADSFWLSSSSPTLCVRRDWWSSVRNLPAFRGVVAGPLETVEPQYIEANPEVRPMAMKSTAIEHLEKERGKFLRMFESDHSVSPRRAEGQA